MPAESCEHCGQEHGGGVSFCPITGKITHPERFFPRGTVIGDKYRLGGVVGAGGMGAVFEATHTMLQKRVAVKLMLPEMAKDRELMSRMVREARTASATGHRNVVLVTDMGWTAEGALFLVMEYLEGRTLRELLRDEGPQPVRRAVGIVFQMLSGLIAVHGHGIVHRDLKPDNVMLVAGDEDEELVKVLDFGISKVLHAEQVLELTRTGSVLGSPRYMSPEQARGLRIDARTDIYSVGGIFYSLLAGRPPLRAPNYTAMIAAILKGEIEPPSTYAPGIPPAIDAIVLRALAREPERRFADAGAFRDALRPYVGSGVPGARGASKDLEPGTGGELPALAPLGPPSATLSHDVSLASLEQVSAGSLGLVLADDWRSARSADSLEVASASLELVGDLPRGTPAAPEELTGSGLVEPATAPHARLGETDQEATLALRPSAATAPPTAPAVAPRPAKRAAVPAQREEARAKEAAAQREEAAPALEPIASSVAIRAKPAADGHGLELDLEDRWRQGQADKHGGGFDPRRPPSSAGTLHRGRGGVGKLLRGLVVLAILGAVALLGWRERSRVAGWFGVTVEPASVLLLIETRPQRADVRVDGVSLVGSSLELQRGDTIHRVRVTAPGYHTQEVEVRANKTRRLLVRLRRKGAH